MNSMPNTLVIMTRNQDEFEKIFKGLDLPNLEIIVPKNDEEIEGCIAQADILLANPLIAHKWINKAEKLVWMQSTFAGVDAMNQDGLRKDYTLTNVRETYGPPMAEYVMGYILQLLRENEENKQAQEKKEWAQKPYSTLKGRTLALMGTGSIAKEIARVAKAFEMRTLGFRTEKKPVQYFDEIYAGDELEEFLSKSDYVVNVLPNTPQTTDIINEASLAHFKEGSVFMNIGRGSAVDEDALIEALKQGKPALAILDVFKMEPLPQDSPLWEMENVLITPHVSGYIMTDRFKEIFQENYRRFLAGEELQYLVDLEKGY